MAQKFGIELEGYGLRPSEIVELLAYELKGIGLVAVRSQRALDVAEGLNDTKIVIVDNSHTHNGPTFTNGYTWQVMRDGSINGEYGFEVVSPILNGSDGKAQVKKVICALKNAGGQVNASCGMHITLATNNSRWKKMGPKKTNKVLGSISDSYAYFRQGINSILAPSRRSNYYCLPIDHEEFCIYSSYHTKFEAINFTKYITSGCIEYRQHQGTLNYVKALNWITLLHKLQTTALNEENSGRTYTDYPPTLEGLIAYLNLPTKVGNYFEARSLTLRGEC